MSSHSQPQSTSAQPSHYYVPHESHYPVVLAGALFLLALGFVFRINGYPAGIWSMLTATAMIVYVLFGWFGAVIAENESGQYKEWESRSFRHGMIWFIASEVAFFAAFFGTLFYIRVISVPDLAGMLAVHDFTLWPGYTGEWPTSGPAGPDFTPMAAWGIPAINTALLLSSGATITWAHWALLKDNRKQLILGLALTVLLGAIFLGFQIYEYIHAYRDLGLTLGAGAYGATFFMLTGFHGFHVTLGVIMLTVVLLRCMRGHFSSERHFAFEAVAWYWHFVDVVWLILFVFVYWI